eukprot:358045-Chlamydomonas_euryale.AAC.5
MFGVDCSGFMARPVGGIGACVRRRPHQPSRFATPRRQAMLHARLRLGVDLCLADLQVLAWLPIARVDHVLVTAKWLILSLCRGLPPHQLISYASCKARSWVPTALGEHSSVRGDMVDLDCRVVACLGQHDRDGRQVGNARRVLPLGALDLRRRAAGAAGPRAGGAARGGGGRKGCGWEGREGAQRQQGVCLGLRDEGERTRGGRAFETPMPLARHGRNLSPSNYALVTAPYPLLDPPLPRYAQHRHTHCGSAPCN